MSEITQTQAPLYEQIGGAPVVEKLVSRFYHLMDTLPEAVELRKMHVGDLTEMIHKLTLFMTGWLGGPQLYIEKYGHPRLRARHFPFPIGIIERDQWLLCMFKAIEDCHLPEPAASTIRSALSRLADHMRNKPEGQ